MSLVSNIIKVNYIIYKCHSKLYQAPSWLIIRTCIFYCAFAIRFNIMKIILFKYVNFNNINSTKKVLAQQGIIHLTSSPGIVKFIITLPD